jgi:anti-sigma-K factor RskA
MPEHDPELEELRLLARRAGLGPHEPAPTLEEPPAGLWERIAEADAAPTVAPVRAARRRWVVPVAAAAAVVAVVVGVAVADRDEQTDRAVVAAAALDPLGPTGSGSAELVDDAGALHLEVDTEGVEAGAGFLEVWMIDPTVERLVSLGPLRADGRYDLPAGLDPRAFPIVDVSVEPIDGDPTHSGDSVLRGELAF